MGWRAEKVKNGAEGLRGQVVEGFLNVHRADIENSIAGYESLDLHSSSLLRVRAEGVDLGGIGGAGGGWDDGTRGRRD